MERRPNQHFILAFAQSLTRSLSIAAAAILAHCASVPPTLAGDVSGSALIVQGQSLAEVHCAPCHSIGKNDQAPVRANQETSFRDLHQRYPIKMLVDAAKTGTIEGHDEMPAFDFSNDEMTALLSYIDSFAPSADLRYLSK